MNVLWTPTLLTAVFALAGAALPGQDLDALLKDIQSPDRNVRLGAQDRIVASGAKAVSPLAKILGGDNRSAATAAKVALTDIAHNACRPGADKERGELSAILVTEYEGAQKAEAKNTLAEILSTTAGKESVPALASMLASAPVRDTARFALTRITAPEAAAALREALEKEKDPDFKVALMNSLGVKRDAEAVKCIVQEAKAPEEEVRLAALEALARIGGPAELARLFFEALPPAGDPQKARARLRVRDAIVVLGERLSGAGQDVAAGRIFRRLFTEASDPAEKCAAIIGLGRTGAEGAADAAMGALKDPSEEIRSAGFEAIALLPGQKGSRVAAGLLKDADPALRVRLLTALGRRSDPGAVEVTAGYLKDPEASVRAAALSALEGKGGKAAARALLEAVREGGPASKEGAVGVLARLSGQEATKAIAEALGLAKGEAKASLIRAIALRQDLDAAGIDVAKLFNEAARSDEESVRAAAFEGLGSLHQDGSVPVLIAGLGLKGKDREAAEKALGRQSSPAATQAILAAARDSSAEVRAALLRVAGRREGAEVVAALLEGAKDSDEAVRMAAIEGLSAQKDAAVLPVLIDAAESGPEKVRPAAVLGCLRFGQAVEEQDRGAALMVYHKALAIAGKDGRLQALAGIGRLADPSSLAVVKPLLADRDKQIQQAAAAAILPAAANLGEDRKAEAIEVLKAALPLAVTSPGARAATERLRALGEDYDIARESGFLTKWWVAGPFANGDKSLFDKDILDPATLDAAAPSDVTADGGTVKWKRFHATDPQGIVDLTQALAPQDACAAYACLEVNLEGEKADRRVSFKIGSDDGVVVWVNGTKIHANNVDRGLGVDSDVVNGRLTPGKNRILVKVINNSGPWQFCFRITDRQGVPLKLEK